MTFTTNSIKPFEIYRDRHGWVLMHHYRPDGPRKIRCRTHAEAVARMDVHAVIARNRAA